MPEPWCPGLIIDPGDFVSYAKGHNRMEVVKVHATAQNGAGNITVGKQGYFQFYCPKIGPGMQFAEADAICWDSGDFNDEGPGIEFEREGTGIYLRDGLQEFEPLTPDQIVSGQTIFTWLHSEWGVPLNLYDGPRYPTLPGFLGFINHGDLDSNRSDGITPAEWDLLTGIPTEEIDGMYVVFSVREGGITENPEIGINSSLDGIMRRGNPAVVKADGSPRIHDAFAVISPEDMEAAFMGGIAATVTTGPLNVSLTGTAVPQ